jgi:hypothetical protein
MWEVGRTDIKGSTRPCNQLLIFDDGEHRFQIFIVIKICFHDLFIIWNSSIAQKWLKTHVFCRFDSNKSVLLHNTNKYYWVFTVKSGQIVYRFIDTFVFNKKYYQQLLSIIIYNKEIWYISESDLQISKKNIFVLQV